MNTPIMTQQNCRNTKLPNCSLYLPLLILATKHEPALGQLNLSIYQTDRQLGFIYQIWTGQRKYNYASYISLTKKKEYLFNKYVPCVATLLRFSNFGLSLNQVKNYLKGCIEMIHAGWRKRYLLWRLRN